MEERERQMEEFHIVLGEFHETLREKVPVEFAQAAQLMLTKIKDEASVLKSSSSNPSKKRNRSEQEPSMPSLQRQEGRGEHSVTIRKLNPDDYKNVRKNDTYLWINGKHRIKDIVRVCKPIKSKQTPKYDYDETVDLHGDADEKLTVRFARSAAAAAADDDDDDDDGTVQRMTYKRKRSTTINLSGTIILKSNFPIERLELLDKGMKRIKNKRYRWLLYDEPQKRQQQQQQQKQHPFDSIITESSSQLPKKPRLSPKKTSKLNPQSLMLIHKTEEHRVGNVDDTPMETESLQKNTVRTKKEPTT
eukprot:CAMPEP_0185255846 /NCGR_PEP_ID=MMETSP1359-20130426/4904_1 /TAXON_ID=552665 /ORGANISM="Bigelowiella longifila, Strain CCMP242" /LENGTH=303 /DNA_ID=CAMNT_0027840031 /DNA_START=117 /DNA_END=1028 /DNA_ORIENTATION=+